MPYSPLPTRSNGDPFTLSLYDIIRENFNSGAPDIIGAKGDLIAGTATDTVGRLAVGANGSILVPDSSQATGLAWQITPAVRVRRTSDLALTTGVYAVVSFDAERYDTSGMHSTTVDTSRLTVPAGGAGIYSIGCCCLIDYDTGSTIGLRILLNGTTIIAATRARTFSGNPTEDDTLLIHTEYALNVGDYVEMNVVSWAAGANVRSVAGYSPEMWASYLRRQ